MSKSNSLNKNANQKPKTKKVATKKVKNTLSKKVKAKKVAMKRAKKLLAKKMKAKKILDKKKAKQAKRIAENERTRTYIPNKTITKTLSTTI